MTIFHSCPVTAVAIVLHCFQSLSGDLFWNLVSQTGFKDTVLCRGVLFSGSWPQRTLHELSPFSRLPSLWHGAAEGSYHGPTSAIVAYLCIWSHCSCQFAGLSLCHGPSGVAPLHQSTRAVAGNRVALLACPPTRRTQWCLNEKA